MMMALAQRIIAAICAPYAINGQNIVIGASIGIAVIDGKCGDAADIMRHADMALYRAKNEGRNRACIYDAAMDADLSSASCSKRTCAKRSKKTGCSWPINRSSTKAARLLSASRRSAAGRIRRAATSRQANLLPSPNTAG